MKKIGKTRKKLGKTRKSRISYIFFPYGEVYRVDGRFFYVRVLKDCPDLASDFIYDWIVRTYKGGFEASKGAKENIINYWKNEYQKKPNSYVKDFPEKIKICEKLFNEIISKVICLIIREAKKGKRVDF